MPKSLCLTARLTDELQEYISKPPLESQATAGHHGSAFRRSSKSDFQPNL